jgi:NCS1 family nucleobase:cation symporter-1
MIEIYPLLSCLEQCISLANLLLDTNISTYLTGSSLIALGLTWWQALISIIIGNVLAMIFIVLNSTPGAFYHLGFPIANRYVWGMYGSQFVVLNRILLSLVWYSVQAWIGGECVYVCLQAIDRNDYCPVRCIYCL